MGKNHFKKYIWMLDTIYRSGGIRKEDIISKWERSAMNDEGTTIAERTFRENIVAIETIFDVSIGCNASNGYTYYIENSEELSKGRVKNWLLTSFSINNMMAESKQLVNRIHFERIPCGNEHLPTLVKAIKENVCLKITRQGFGDDTPSVTILKLYGIKVFKQRWYLVGVPHYCEKIKTFALDRIHQIELTKEHFDMPEDFDLDTLYYNHYGIIIDLEEHPIDTIRIKAKNVKDYHQVDYLRTLPLHHSQKEVEKHKEYSIFEFKLSPSYDFIQEILSKADEVEVLSPEWFREEVASYARSLYNMYKDSIANLDKRDAEEKSKK